MQDLSFDEFLKTTESDWYSALGKELKGKSPDTLLWKDEDMLTHNPYYRPGQKYPFSIPDMNGEWAVLEEFDLLEAGMNEALLTALSGGVNAIGVRGAMNFDDCERSFRDVIFPYVQWHFDPKSSESFGSVFDTLIQKGGFNRDSIMGSVQSASPDEVFPADILRDWPSMKVVAADARQAHSIGSSPSDDLLFCLSRGHEVLLTLLRSGLDAQRISNGIQFNITCGRSFFIEIAKMLSLRILWKKLAAHYGVEGNITLMVSTSDFWQSGIDVENNLLRATAQSMAAICGGADVLHVRPHDQWKGDGGEESRRWARNISHLISDESALSSHRQSARNAHLIQSLVASLCDHTWKRFTESEDAGGWQVVGNSLLSGFSDRGCSVQKAVADGTQVMIGVNKYPGKPDENLGNGKSGRASATIENSGV